MDAAVPSIAASGTAEDPKKVAASTWRKMSKAAREPWELARSLRERGVVEIVPHNPAPALALAGPVAGRALATTKEALLGDIVVIRTLIPRGTKAHPEPPLAVEAHINLLAIGAGLVGAGLAALFGIIAWRGVKIGGFEVFGGIKQALAERREEKEDVQAANTCADLEARWVALRSDWIWFLKPWVVVELQAIEHDARLLGCAWLTGA